MRIVERKLINLLKQIFHVLVNVNTPTLPPRDYSADSRLPSLALGFSEFHILEIPPVLSNASLFKRIGDSFSLLLRKADRIRLLNCNRFEKLIDNNPRIFP